MMYKEHKIILLCLLFLSYSTLDATEPASSTSTIVLPLQVDLRDLQHYIETTIPQTLTTVEENNRICVQAQYLKTKGIPKCSWKNGNISCKSTMVKIQTVPEIACDISGWVKRDGNITLRGDNNTLKILLPIKAKIETLSPLKSVATASATLYLNLIPRIQADWSVDIQVQASFVWSKKPTLTLLDGIQIDIQDRVEQKLQKRIDRFVNTLPSRLKKLKLKKKVSTLWQKIQQPIRLDKKSQSSLYFTPHRFSYSGFRVKDNTLETTLSIRGTSKVHMGKVTQKQSLIPLAPLENIPFQKGKFSFDIPVSSHYTSLSKMLDKQLGNGYHIKLDNPLISGLMTLSNPQLSQGKHGELQLVADLHYESYTSWIDTIDGNITIAGKPLLNNKKNILSLQDLHYRATTNHKIFDTFINASHIQPLQSYLNKHLHIDFSHKLDKVVQKANQALASINQKHFILFGYLHVAQIETITIQAQQLTLNTKLEGEVNASVDFERLMQTTKTK